MPVKGVRLANTLRRASQDPEMLPALERHGISEGVPFVDTINDEPLEFASHQRKALRKLWTLHPPVFGTRGFILAAVMGAGKTLMALTYGLSNVPRGPDKLPWLVVCSRTLLGMWEREGIDKFINPASGLKVLYLHGSYLKKDQIANLSREDLLQYDIVLTTYDFVVRADTLTGANKDVRVMGRPNTFGESEWKLKYLKKRTYSQANRPDVTGRGILFSTPWPLVVADEPQRFANYKTLTFQAMMSVYGDTHLCLTGTPVKNYDTDVWSLMRWMGYSVVKVPHSRKAGRGWKIGLLDVKCPESRLTLRSLIIRITENDVPKLPPKVLHTMTVPLTGNAASANIKFLRETQSIVNQARGSNQSWHQDNFAKVLASFTRLRELSVAPTLILPKSKRPRNRKRKADNVTNQGVDEADEFLNPATVLTPTEFEWINERTGDAGYGAAKVTKIIQTVQSTPVDEKVMVFANFTSTIDLLAEVCGSKNIKFLKLDGGVKPRHRMDLVNSFRTQDYKVLFLTYPVGAEGLNVTCANHVILSEPWWNAATTDQAVARAWRRGQKKSVHVYQVLTEHTIEPSIMAICGDKQALAGAVLGDVDVSTYTQRKRTRLNLDTIGRIVNKAMAGASKSMSGRK